MNDRPITSATDAVRYLYLARVTERAGHPRAARSWYQKADRWLETIGQPSGPPSGQGARPADTSPE